MRECPQPPQVVSTAALGADAAQLHGEPDLAGAAALPRVTVPALPIGGGSDQAVDG
jgi:hypothetical protein